MLGDIIDKLDQGTDATPGGNSMNAQGCELGSIMQYFSDMILSNFLSFLPSHKVVMSDLFVN